MVPEVMLIVSLMLSAVMVYPVTRKLDTVRDKEKVPVVVGPPTPFRILAVPESVTVPLPPWSRLHVGGCGMLILCTLRTDFPAGFVAS